MAAASLLLSPSSSFLGQSNCTTPPWFLPYSETSSCETSHCRTTALSIIQREEKLLTSMDTSTHAPGLPSSCLKSRALSSLWTPRPEWLQFRLAWMPKEHSNLPEGTSHHLGNKPEVKKQSLILLTEAIYDTVTMKPYDKRLPFVNFLKLKN